MDDDGTRLEQCAKPNSPHCDYSKNAHGAADGQAWFLNYAQLGTAVGALLDEKQKRYGDSFHRAHQVLKVLYPTGIPVEHYHLMMFMCRSLDKWFRLATGGPDQEDPIADLAGYALLMMAKNRHA